MKGPEVVIISAVAVKNRLIGRGQELPWHISDDLKRFKFLTSGRPVLMGKRTFESLIHQNGRPLPGRRNLVLAHGSTWPEWENVEVFDSIPDALAAVSDVEQVFITGGASVYEAFLPTADRLELTLVDGDFEGDVFFPPYEHLIGSMYEETARDTRDGFSFVTYTRK
ncbi:MAG: dihydrofolate reductase [Bacteroidetes bacterium]|nr:dihydrofolate reductase [Bacteroidota bacterium]